METATLLHGFAYGEHIEAGRSLGYRLLAGRPDRGAPKSRRSPTGCRRPYPDDWPVAEFFCSALLADGWRVVAAARYGLLDHTPSQRRGGIELVGVITPGRLSVPSALALYRWVKRRRADDGDLRSLGGYFDLAEALTQVPPEPLRPETTPAPPEQTARDGARVFAATAPADPDHHFALLLEDHDGNWQWLALVGDDFPLAEYTARGPVIAWKP